MPKGVNQNNLSYGHVLLVVIIAAVLGGTACTTNQLFIAEEQKHHQLPDAPDADPVYQVFLIGDAGLFDDREIPPSPEADPTLGLLQRKLANADSQSAVVFLGDNVYCCGIPDTTHPNRAEAEKILRLQLRAVDDFSGQIVFVPGNHDWNPPHPSGREAILRQEAFVESYLNRGNVFLPDSASPGPVEVELTDDLTLVTLDTQWWLARERGRRSGARTSPAVEEGQVLIELDDIVQRNRNNNLLVVGHHPMFSIGHHGGYFGPRAHLFPLTELVSNLYLPLPGLGSLYPMYRRFIGGRQDLAHVQYTQMRRAFTTIFQQHEDLVYAAGHDHNLQYFRKNNQHYLVSGAGSSPRHVAGGRGAQFTYEGAGFLTLQYYMDGSVWLEAWTSDTEDPDGRLLFRSEITPPGPPGETSESEASETATDRSDSTVTRAVNPGYAAGPIKRFFLGSHNRYAWTIPVTAPVFHARRVAGGLIPLQRTGSAQTPGLRLAGPAGEEYVLRSIEKDPLQSLPEMFHDTFVRDIRQDQTSTMHPYGAFLVPHLAEALRLFHTNPRLYYVPAESGLGVYAPILANRFALFEERPDEDVSAVASFGRSTDAMSYRKVYRRINEDNDHRVDQRMYARTRLLDMLVADWDRHPDQWRWVSFEPPDEQGKIYRPIPRDRDFAFFRMDGLFPWLVKRFVLWEYQDFGRNYGNLKGLTENGLSQDRRFTSALSREDWLEIADSMQTALSDSVIDAAVDRWEQQYDPVRGDEIGELLKIRRDQLTDVAEHYYRLMAKYVDVVGSHKHERFEVERRSDEETVVRVLKTTKDQEVREEMYRRIVSNADTEQIRLFGLNGRDQFSITGTADQSPEVIAVGGPGPDRFEDQSRVGGLGKKTRFQDTPDVNHFVTGSETSIVLLDDVNRNTYDPSSYRYDRTFPIGEIGYNVDEGFRLGGGTRILRHGFQKSPFASQQRVRAGVATGIGAVDADYEGYFVSLLRGFDLSVSGRLLGPNSVRNFYGLGNETPRTDRVVNYYRVRLSRLQAAIAPTYRTPDGLTVSAGPSIDYTNLSPRRNRFVYEPQAGIEPNTFDDHLSIGLGAELQLQNVDSRPNPRQGFAWDSEVRFFQLFPETLGRYGQLRSMVALYASPRFTPQITLAMRVGGATNIGQFPFYRANALGGQRNLRGYRSTRFSGRSSLYQNLELRTELRSFSSYLGWGSLGALVFLDNGRVWTDGESSKMWHQGYGGGLWLDLFDRFVLTGTAGFSGDDRTFTTRLGFMF